MKFKKMINKIVQGDCLSVMKKIPENSIDLVLTSPPYNIGIEYDCWDDNMDFNEYYEWCKKWMKEIYRILKRDGKFCLNHYFSLGKSDERYTPLMDLNYIATRELNFKHHGVAFWTDKTYSKKTAWGSWQSPSSPYINSPFEGILILYKEKWKKENKGISTINKKDFMKACSGVWDFSPDKLRLTPATFPEELAKICINLFTYKEDIVLDPFNGSGTTTVVARKLKRKFIGIEISPKYCKIAENRLNGIYIFRNEKYEI